MRRICSNKKSFAVTGAYPGAGATHFSLCLANYMASKEKKKVIYIELGENSTLANMVRGEIVDLDGVLGYKYMKVIYVLTNELEIIRKLLMTRDEFIVLDLGTMIAECNDICNLCSSIYVIGSYKPWNRDRFGGFIQKNIIRKHDLKKVKFFAMETDRIEKKSFQDRFHIELNSVPIVLNPLCIRQADFCRIAELM